MRLWRLAKTCHEHATLEDEAKGAKQVGGRWNSKGIPVVYAAFNVATACMEVLVHVDWLMAPELVLLAIDVPDDITIDVVDHQDLPDDWSVFPAPRQLAEIGDDWAKNGNSLILEVPSAACPYERNAILNPFHSDASRCSIQVLGPYHFDGRLKG